MKNGPNLEISQLAGLHRRSPLLAFDFWTAYSPTWDEKSNGEIENGAPSFAGATLGGLWRLRGYPSQRFSDKAAIYYAAEARFIPRWNPFDGWPWIQKMPESRRQSLERFRAETQLNA